LLSATTAPADGSGESLWTVPVKPISNGSSSRSLVFRNSDPEKTPAVVDVPKIQQEKPAFREVIDLTQKPTAAPAGAISADEIVLKEKALQFSKIKGRKKANVLFDDVGQRSFLYQLVIALVAIGASIAFFIIALKVFRALFG